MEELHMHSITTKASGCRNILVYTVDRAQIEWTHVKVSDFGVLSFIQQSTASSSFGVLGFGDAITQLILKNRQIERALECPAVSSEDVKKLLFSYCNKEVDNRHCSTEVRDKIAAYLARHLYLSPGRFESFSNYMFKVSNFLFHCRTTATFTTVSRI